MLADGRLENARTIGNNNNNIRYVRYDDRPLPIQTQTHSQYTVCAQIQLHAIT